MFRTCSDYVKYVHRSGRAGRAGRTGVVLTIASHCKDGERIEEVEKHISKVSGESFQLSELTVINDESKEFTSNLKRIRDAEVVAVRACKESKKGHKKRDR